MWQAASFDPETIERELGWAADLGMNVIRVYLHDLLFKDDAEAFLARIAHVMDISQKRGISLIPVLLDGVWHPSPKLGPQPEPKPRRHNSIWVQSPGSRVLQDRSLWPQLKDYVQGVISHFAGDSRIVAWDLFNEPDQIDATTMANGSREGKAAAATDLLQSVFSWAREIDPAQPVTAGIWEYADDHQPADSALNQLILEHSDIISFHCYEPRAQLMAVIDALSKYERPLLCTEWLARTAGSTVDLLNVFADRNVGAINWGLVDGRTQTRFPWKSWTEVIDDDEPWFHELLRGDGSPYDVSEVEIFKQLTSLRV
jgi:endo-1,4-beta-mannosidase